MENKGMTVQEVVEQVISELGGINVPVNQLESIGIPIARAISGLKVCVDAWKQSEQAAQEEEPKVEMKLVPAEEVPEEERDNG